MTRTLTLSLLAAVAAAVALGAAAGVADAAPGIGSPKVVPIAMKDPGCHWFFTGGRYRSRLVVSGETTFFNTDESALVFKGPGLSRRLPVGSKLAISTPGTYRITMVGQAPDDNHLVLVVR